jgi:hypothetical protein
MSLEWARARARENEARLASGAAVEGRAKLVQHPLGLLQVILRAPADTRQCWCSERLGIAPRAGLTGEGNASTTAGSDAETVLSAHSRSEELQEIQWSG